MSVIIYGDSTDAYNTHYILKTMGITPIAFAVTDTKHSLAAYQNIPILAISDLVMWKDSAKVLVATGANSYPAIVDTLKKYGFTQYEYVGLDSPFDKQFREDYFPRIFQNMGYSYIDVRQLTSKPVECLEEQFKIFEVKSHYDKVICAETAHEFWITPIQAGAAQTDLKLGKYQDNMGVSHISQKNGNYSELTATYWIWKNITTPYVGLCHYRRHFDLSVEQISGWITQDFDVLLPHWGLYAPNVKTCYERMSRDWMYFDLDWSAMKTAIQNVMPDYMETANKVENECYILHYNMLVAKHPIFADYCNFLFSVLFEVERHFESIGINRKDRYLGYLGEILTTIYFRKHAEYKCAHCHLNLWTKNGDLL